MNFGKLKYSELKNLVVKHLGINAWDALDDFDRERGFTKIVAYLGAEKEKLDYTRRYERLADSKEKLKAYFDFCAMLRTWFLSKLEAAIKGK